MLAPCSSCSSLVSWPPEKEPLIFFLTLRTDMGDHGNDREQTTSAKQQAREVTRERLKKVGTKKRGQKSAATPTILNPGYPR